MEFEEDQNYLEFKAEFSEIKVQLGVVFPKEIPKLDLENKLKVSKSCEIEGCNGKPQKDYCRKCTKVICAIHFGSKVTIPFFKDTQLVCTFCFENETFQRALRYLEKFKNILNKCSTFAHKLGYAYWEKAWEIYRHQLLENAPELENETELPEGFRANFEKSAREFAESTAGRLAATAIASQAGRVAFINGPPAIINAAKQGTTELVEAGAKQGSSALGGFANFMSSAGGSAVTAVIFALPIEAFCLYKDITGLMDRLENEEIDEEDHKNEIGAKIAEKLGKVGGAVGGAAGGTAAGAAIGSIIPGPGTVIGGAIGGIFGGLLLWLGVGYGMGTASRELGKWIITKSQEKQPTQRVVVIKKLLVLEIDLLLRINHILPYLLEEDVDPGQVTVDRDNRLGTGGNGTEVFQGKFKMEKVAVKIYSVTKLQHEDAVMEIKLMRWILDHKNILKIKAVYVDMPKGSPSIHQVMELIQPPELRGDASLRRFCGTSTPHKRNLTLKEKKFIAISVSEALAFLYEKKVFHKDIKPENILVSADKKIVKLTDFGLSNLKTTLASSTTSQGKGTNGYWPPESTRLDIHPESGELIASSVIPSKWDMFSTGVTMVEMYAECSLWFKKANMAYTTNEIAAILMHPDPKLFKALPLWKSGIYGRLDQRVKDLLEKPIAWDPKDRPTPDEMLEAFKKLP